MAFKIFYNEIIKYIKLFIIENSANRRYKEIPKCIYLGNNLNNLENFVEGKSKGISEL